MEKKHIVTHTRPKFARLSANVYFVVNILKFTHK